MVGPAHLLYGLMLPVRFSWVGVVLLRIRAPGARGGSVGR